MLAKSLSPYPIQEKMLLDLAERLAKLCHGRIAAHLHLSGLRESRKQEHYIRIATETFTRKLRTFEGQFFSLENSDIVFVAKDSTLAALNGPVDTVRALFSGDPIAQYDQDKETQTFCSWYNLEKNYDDFLEACQTILHKAELARLQEDEKEEQEEERKPIRTEQMARLEVALSRVDVSSMSRRQTICTLIDNQPPKPLFEEIFVSIQELESNITPGHNLLENTWLFQHLTKTLDQRVMTMLMRDGINTARPFSLNLNIATILSPEFAKFESAITPQLRGRLVIELNKLDVFSDMGAFIFARDYLREHGFRLCLDGLTNHTLFYYDRERLGFDLVKIYWTPESINEILPEMIPSIRNIVMNYGQAHTILCRCDDANAIKVGQELGIVMFQGREVDKMIRAQLPNY